MCSCGPTGVAGSAPLGRLGRLGLRWYRVRRRLHDGYWWVRRSPLAPDTLARTIAFGLLGVAWETACGHTSGFTRGWPPYFMRCPECLQYGLTRHRLGARRVK